jgi:hypothetical protein
VAERITTYTVEQLDRHADAFSDLVVSGLRRVLDQAVERASRDGVIVAAVQPEPIQEDPPPSTLTEDFLAFIQQLWAQFVGGELVPYLIELMTETGHDHLVDLTGAIGTIAFGEPLPQAFTDRMINQPLETDQFIRQAENRLVGIGDDLWEHARDEIAEGISEGESIGQLAERIAEAAEVTEPRARTIARTEANGAMNSTVDRANHRVSDMFGIDDGIMKEWSSTEDLRTRPSHVAADGQVVGLNDPFIVGNASLAFPSDPAGPPGEVINCRCTTLTVISDDVIALARDIPLPVTAAANMEEDMPYDIVQGGGDCAESQWAVVKQGTDESVGCHDTEEEAIAQVAAIMSSEDEDEGAAPTGSNGVTSGFNDEGEAIETPVDDGRFVTWSGVIALEGVPTGDGRQFEHGALTWADLPMPLGWMYERSHGGMPTDKVANVGTIDTITRGEGGMIVASGRIDLRAERGWQLASMMGTREDPGSVAGISIDADDPDDPMGMNVEYVFPEGCEGNLENDDGTLQDEEDMKCMMPNLMKYSSGRIRAATLVDIPAFMEARIYLDKSLDDPGDDGVGDPIDDEDVILASAYTMTLHDIPPIEWFDEPDVEPEIGAITVTDEGRFFGYLAPKHVAHRAVKNKRLEVPTRNVDYGIWMNRVTIADDGKGGFTRIATGPITMDCGHAPMSNRVTGSARTKHYDNSCSVVATARVGENSRGVWIAGSLLPDVTPEQVRRMMALQLSGDWGPHREKPGKRELVAALLVPVPGFPKRSYSTMTVKRGMLSHVGVPLRFATTESRDDTKIFGARTAADRIAVAVGRDRATRARELAARVRGE